MAAAGGKAAVRRAGEGKARRRGALPEAVDPGGGARHGASAGAVAFASSAAPCRSSFFLHTFLKKIISEFFILDVHFFSFI